MKVIIAPETIDSFRARPREWVSKKCAFKNCKHIGTVILYYTPKHAPEQQREQICGEHALLLANGILSHYKFKRGPDA